MNNTPGGKSAGNIHDEAKEKTRQLKEKLDKIKGKTCQDCKNNYPPFVLSFYLVDEDLLVSPDITEENLKNLAKADLVCANCLRMRMYNKRTTK